MLSCLALYMDSLWATSYNGWNGRTIVTFVPNHFLEKPQELPYMVITEFFFFQVHFQLLFSFKQAAFLHDATHCTIDS
jgi:hypothetical protein